MFPAPRAAIRTLLAALLLAVATWVAAPAARAQEAPSQGPGGPILILQDPGDPFGSYYAEILRAEGLNEFAVADAPTVTAQSLAGYDVVILARTTLDAARTAVLSDWVGAGGNLIAMRPDKRLAPLLGLADAGSTLDNAYLRVNTDAAPGAGITGATLQYHSTADRYGLAGASAVASLYSDASTPTASPAVTLRSVGANGGQAAAFTYDLARSVVYTRQGNPAWAGDERDGSISTTAAQAIRSDDMFFGAKPGDLQPDWVNFDRITIPQADEQQRLLANLITSMTLDRVPLPRFWYLPRGAKAAVVMTGDDHSTGGTSGQFDWFASQSPAGCSVADWQCVRSTSYIYPNTPLTGAQNYQAAGFEIALHYNVSGTPGECHNFTSAASLSADFDSQLAALAAAQPTLAAPVTSRTHCIVFSDWATEPKVELSKGIRLDTNYYYWPADWVKDRPGLFTGSGFPMRFADTNGAIIDVYQAATQMTDESGQTYPFTVNTLLDNALGPNGYYGVFTANMHTDDAVNPEARAVVASALARGVPVVSAKQMLEWLDGRNRSSFAGLSYAGGQLRFRVQSGAGARGLQAMIPANGPSGALGGLTRDGQAVATTQRVVKGVAYAVFDAAAGSYVAQYPVPPVPAPAPAPVKAPAPAAVPPARSAARDTTKPAISVAIRSRLASRRGTLSLRVGCPKSEVSCRVSVVAKRGRIIAARTTATVRGGKTVTLHPRLTAATRRLLAKRRRLTLTFTFTTTDAAGNRAVRTLRATVRPA